MRQAKLRQGSGEGRRRRWTVNGVSDLLRRSTGNKFFRFEVSGLPAASRRRHESAGTEACVLPAKPPRVERPDC